MVQQVKQQSASRLWGCHLPSWPHLVEPGIGLDQLSVLFPQRLFCFPKTSQMSTYLIYSFSQIPNKNQTMTQTTTVHMIVSERTNLLSGELGLLLFFCLSRHSQHLQLAALAVWSNYIFMPTNSFTRAGFDEMRITDCSAANKKQNVV